MSTSEVSGTGLTTRWPLAAAPAAGGGLGTGPSVWDMMVLVVAAWGATSGGAVGEERCLSAREGERTLMVTLEAGAEGEVEEAVAAATAEEELWGSLSRSENVCCLSPLFSGLGLDMAIESDEWRPESRRGRLRVASR